MTHEVSSLPPTADAAERSVSIDNDVKAHGRNEVHDLMVANAKLATGESPIQSK